MGVAHQTAQEEAAWWWVADRALLSRASRVAASSIAGVLATGPELGARATAAGMPQVQTLRNLTAGSVVPTDLSWYLAHCAPSTPTGAALREAATVDGVCLWPMIEYEVYQVELGRWLERLVPLGDALEARLREGAPLLLAHRPLPPPIAACLATGGIEARQIALDGADDPEPEAAALRPTMPPPLRFLQGQSRSAGGNVRRMRARGRIGSPLLLVLQQEMVATSAGQKTTLGLFEGVAEGLEALGQPFVVVLNHTGAVPPAHHRLDERFHLFVGELTPAQEVAVRLGGRRLRQRFAHLQADEAFVGGWRAGALDLWPLIRPALSHAFSSRLVGALRLLLGQRRLLRTLAPSAVALVFEYGVFGRTLQWAAGERGIPTVSLQHGNVFAGAAGFSWHPPGPQRAGAVQHAVPPPSATVPDYMCAYGPFVGRSLSTMGVPRSVVLASGPVHYDRLMQMGTSPPPAPEGLAQLPPVDGPLLVYTSQPLASQESRALYLEGVVSALAEDPRWRLWVKPHPREDAEQLTRQIDSLHLDASVRDRIRVDKEVDLGALMHHAWVVLSVYSTTATEAVLLERPVIVLSFEGLPQRMPYASSGVALEADCAIALRAALRRLRDDPSVTSAMAAARGAFLADHLCGRRLGNRTLVAKVLQALARGQDPVDVLPPERAQG